ncbi:MAG: CHASE domain-containing protein, partial [Candidatus Kapabacteria bacterium]|nr:CHASE domain-containing protein [Candidatus Kapabacteria bacterium]
MKKMLPIVLTVVAGVALSVIGMNLTNYKVESDRQIEFDKSVSSVLSRVQNATANQEQVVKNLDGLFAASVQVVRDVFELYSTVPAKSNPYILSIGYASKVTAQDADNFVYYNRSERYYDYQIKPSGTRSLYQPISYIVPFEQNAHLSGYDLLSNQTFSEIIQKAQTKKGLVCSPVFNFRGGDTNSIVLMQTVEKKKSASSLTPEETLFQTTSDMFDGIIYVELNATK